MATHAQQVAEPGYEDVKAVAHLRKARKRANLTILTNAHA